jgi:hypothetical protein
MVTGANYLSVIPGGALWKPGIPSIVSGTRLHCRSTRIPALGPSESGMTVTIFFFLFPIPTLIYDMPRTIRGPYP